MIGRSACLAGVALVLVPASASAGAGTVRPPVALIASPSHVALDGAARATIRLSNSGATRVSVDVSRAGFALDFRGRPRIVGDATTARSAARWLTFGPRKLTIRPRSSSVVTIVSALPRRAEPGDHDALLLFTTHPRVRDGVAVRIRMGVVVVVRAPGSVVHRLALGRLRSAGSGRRTSLELLVANTGNVTESFQRADAAVSLFAAGRRAAKLAAVPRELRPHTRGVLVFRLPAHLRGSMTARLVVRVASGRLYLGSYRLRI
jgi:hypothetical protein